MCCSATRPYSNRTRSCISACSPVIPSEATENARNIWREEYLADYYEKVGLPALLLAELDRQRGVMTERQLHMFSANCRALVDNLSYIAEEEENEEVPIETGGEETGVEKAEAWPRARDGRSCAWEAGARWTTPQPPCSPRFSRSRVQPSGRQPRGSDGTHHRTAADGRSGDRRRDVPERQFKAHARLVVRRIKRLKADLRVGILIPLANGVDNPRIEPSEIGADFVCQTLPKTIEQALTAALPFCCRFRCARRPAPACAW